MQLVRALLANTTSGAAEAATRRGEMRIGGRAAEKAEVGPILVVTYTNHALDRWAAGDR